MRLCWGKRLLVSGGMTVGALVQLAIAVVG